jgi:methylated-DNA-protein-cysteine methyltransferase related protein
LARHPPEPPESPDDFGSLVEAVIESIPAGTVMTYGEIAREAGFPGAARAVGTLLARSGGTLPWWRVVNASGRLIPGHESEHARRLLAEGVELTRSRRVRFPAG